ncbi:MAG: ribonuclease R family protein, partial [Coprococcus sp.]
MNEVVFEARRQMILDFIEEKTYKPMKFKELCMVFSVPKKEKEEFKEFLDQLIAKGDLMMTSQGRYKKAEADTLTGKFCGSTRGFGFVTVEGMAEDIFIPPDETGGAFHGDTVLIQMLSPTLHSGNSHTSRRAEGKVLQVVNRGFEEIVGTFQKNKNYGFVIPDNQKIANDIFIPAGKTMHAVNGHRVVAKITDYGSGTRNPEGIITEILGHADDPKTDVLSVVRAFGIPSEFPDEVRQQLISIPEAVSAEETAGRMDLRNIMTVTIDGEDAKDLDDAITLEKRGDHYLLGVHIADVTHYVIENSPLDREALNRGTSVYLVNKVIPMLPHQLSNGICSLNEGVDRLALSCLMEIDARGGIIGHEIAETVIRVNHRMSYTQVSRILEGDRTLSETY